PVIQDEEPVRVAILPSAVIAYFNVRNGRPVRTHLKYASVNRLASGARSPTIVSIPASCRARRPPPFTHGLVSVSAACTEPTPAATMASTHGGVRPWWLHGSKVTKRVAPKAAAPAWRRATISACAWPGACVQPSPTIAPAWTTTAPTGGLGLHQPMARRA